MGFFFRKCSCGRRLPASCFNGRGHLNAKCPACGYALSGGNAAPVCITVVGGPSVGKTSYIAALLRELVNDVCPLMDMDVSFFGEKNFTEYRNLSDKYRLGHLQTKTSDFNPAAYNLFISKANAFSRRQICLYDIAGEAFETSDALLGQRQYGYSHGFIFIIDPLSLPCVRQKYMWDAKFPLYGAGSAETGDTLDAFINCLKKIGGVAANHCSDKPCAVLINKTDAYDLEEIIGAAAAKKAVKERGITSERQAFNVIIKEFLLENGQQNLVNNLELFFKNVQFFSCSTIGHIPDGSEFKPVRTLEPFRWIVSGSDKKMGSVLDKYCGGKISAKIPRNVVRLGKQSFIVLSSAKLPGKRYYCFTDADNEGKPAGNKIYVATGNIRKFETVTFLDNSHITEEERKAVDMLKCTVWRRKLRYYHENKTERKW